MENKLPEKLSAAIRLAVEDMKKVKADPRYQLDMSTWHSKIHGKICEVCLAGSIIAQTLHESIDDRACPWSLMENHKISCHDEDVLLALDEIRCGDIEAALYEMGNDDRDYDFPCVEMSDYVNNFEGFCKDLIGIAEMLEGKEL